MVAFRLLPFDGFSPDRLHPSRLSGGPHGLLPSGPAKSRDAPEGVVRRLRGLKKLLEELL